MRALLTKGTMPAAITNGEKSKRFSNYSNCSHMFFFHFSCLFLFNLPFPPNSNKSVCTQDFFFSFQPMPLSVGYSAGCRLSPSLNFLNVSFLLFYFDMLVFRTTLIVDSLSRHAQAQTPGSCADLLLLCAHCKHSTEAEEGSSPWTHQHTQTVLGQATENSPSCVHKLL